MRKSVLHSNLLGRWGNGLLKFVVLVVMACSMNGAYADIWSEGGTYPSSQTIGSSKKIDKGITVTINGDLEINYGVSLTIMGGTLYVKGDLKLNRYATLELDEGSILVIEKDFVQKTGATFLAKSYVNADKSTIVIKGNYTIEGTFAGSSGLINTSDNEVYVFGPKTGVSGTKDETAFETKYGSLSSLLPIELTSFTATATDYGFEFNWVTASEVENDYFTLEYSIDGVDFNEIDYVHGAGTTSEMSEYTYRWDEAPEFDVVYFRLKQTDYNGEYSYSDVIVASRKKSSGANGTFRYGPLNLQIQDGELRYIQK